MPGIEQTIAEVNVRRHTFKSIPPEATKNLRFPNSFNRCHASKLGQEHAEKLAGVVVLVSRTVANMINIRSAMLLLLLGVGCPVWSQTSSSTGAVEGWIVDASQASVVSAHVEARNQETGLTRSVESDARGYYRIGELPVGTYMIEVSQAGFALFRHKDVAVTLGSVVRIDAKLQLASETQQITVSEPPPLIDPAQTSMTNSVGHERIEESPVRTRNALDFVLMEPNVVSTGSSAGEAGATASTGLGARGFSFGGMRPTGNRIAIDGMENNDEFGGGSRTELSPEIVQEFQVVNNGMSAESGGASGGAVNIVTRSGVNAMHGDAFIFLQKGALDARRYRPDPEAG